MSNQTNKPRAFQFSLRGLFAAVTLIGVGFGGGFSALKPDHLGIGPWFLIVLILGGAAIGAGLGVLVNRKRAGTVFGLFLGIIVCWLNLTFVIWDGWTNLEVRFVIVDATTDKPIPNATVDVREYNDGLSSRFILKDYANGIASTECPDSPCSGHETWLGLGDTFYVRLPPWRYRITAPGYQPSPWIDLFHTEDGRKVKRVKAGEALLVIRAPLQPGQATSQPDFKPLPTEK